LFGSLEAIRATGRTSSYPYKNQLELNKMKKHVLIGISLILMVALSVVGTLRAGQATAQSECTLSTLQGTYIFEARGVHTNEEGAVVPYAESGVWTLDGEGNAAGFISASSNGTAFARREPFTATYELSSDCVYSVVDQFGFEVDLYASASGSHIMYFSPGFSGTQIRQ
jgi:hypothetical protein